MKLFLRIFLSFFIATLLMVGAVLAVSDFLPTIFPGDGGRLFEPGVTQFLLAKAVDAYEQHGADAFLAGATVNHRSLYLLDHDGKVLVKDGPTPPFYLPMAEGALRSGHSELLRLGSGLEFACRIQSATGRQYAIVLTISQSFRPLRLRFWFNLLIAMLPMALVCMALSLYLTRPITRLRTTAQRLASGDLSARSSPHRNGRGDELGDLARDFDTMAARLQLLMTAQKRFVADVSHELSAPLTRMHLALALLRRRFATQDIRELERIEHETDRLSNLVQQLLLLAGMEAGSCPAETLAPVSIPSLFQNIVEDANFEAAHSNCRITSTYPEIVVMAFPQLLRRSIDNVLRNAIHYAPSGSEVVLRCRVTLDRVVIEVLDSGPGVPESTLTEIFQPFFSTSPGRTSAGRENSSGGTGLGLAIAAEALRLHDGTIVAANRDGGGLHVTIAFPLRMPVPDPELQSASESGPAQQEHLE
jgi:signal transduction histidine kinase